MSATDDDVLRVARLEAVPTILRVITETTGLRLSLIARVTRDRWLACAVRDVMAFGLSPGDELEIATTLCSEVRDSRKPLVISHVSQDPSFCTHRATKLYNFESYIAVPIFREGGEYFGNVCALDSRPMPIGDEKTLAMMELFATLIGLQLDADERSAVERAALLDERHTAELREQFIAVLGHDLRTPLSAIALGARLLRERVAGDADLKIVQRIENSARRIAGLLDDLTDFTRGRLGNGLTITIREVENVRQLLEPVIEELRGAYPTREIHLDAANDEPLRCDGARLKQLISNLVANALLHGDSRSPVDVTVRGAPERVVLKVSNQGPPIPAAILPVLFQPYVRNQGASAPQGLGLGLFIVDQIARAHGGSVSVESNDRATSFTCVIPRR